MKFAICRLKAAERWESVQVSFKAIMYDGFKILELKFRLEIER